MYPLRPYQIQVNRDTTEAYKAGRRSILVVVPTGGGKTVMFTDLAARASRKNNSVLILTHRQEILAQTLEKLHAFGVTSGQVAAGRIMTKNPIKVGMVQTVVNRLHLIPEPRVIIIDEGHHAVANSWRKTLSAYPGALKLFYTATPERLDGRGLGDICDCMIQGPDIIQMVADGWLVMPMIKTPDKQQIKNFHITRGDFDKNEQKEFLTGRAIVGDVIEHHRKYLRHQPTISFVVNLAHGAAMEGIYRDAGIKAKLIQGGQKYMAERKRACQELADGSLEILISCDVISEGFDVPVCAGCHLLRRTMSLGLYLQQAGRTLRPIYAPGYCLDTRPGRLATIKNGPKPVSYILDFVGNYLLHGHVMERREWDLSSTKRDPRKTEPSITRCPRCGGVWPGKPRICPDPACRYNFVTASMQRKEFEIQQVAGQLVDAIPGLDPERLHVYAEVLATKPRQTIQKFMMRQMFAAQTEDQKKAVAELARLAGYSDKWIPWADRYVRKKNGGKLKKS